MRHYDNIDKGHRLIRDILSKRGNVLIDALANDLLHEFYQGFPLENLRCLLSNPTEEVIKIGIWIASELGKKATPLLDDVAKLVSHSLVYVRFFAIDSVLSCATAKDEKTLSTVISKLNDEAGSVRWKVIDFLARASSEQLRAALNNFARETPESIHVNGLKILLRDSIKCSEEAAMILLQNDNALLRKYGAALAFRIAQVNIRPLMFAASIDDLDVTEYANDMLKLPSNQR